MNKLTNIRKLGRYINNETGQKVNLHRGRNPKRSTDHTFFIRNGVRIFITCASFHHDWSKIDDVLPLGG